MKVKPRFVGLHDWSKSSPEFFEFVTKRGEVAIVVERFDETLLGAMECHEAWDINGNEVYLSPEWFDLTCDAHSVSDLTDDISAVYLVDIDCAADFFGRGAMRSRDFIRFKDSHADLPAKDIAAEVIRQLDLPQYFDPEVMGAYLDAVIFK